MPQAIAAAAVFVTKAAMAAFAPGLIGTATGAAVIAGVGTVASVGTSLAISAGLAAALTPGLPSPEFAATPIKQSRPVRVSGTGRARLSGAYVLFEARGNLSDDVLALHHGKIDGIERYFLHDDEVTINSGGWVLDPGGSRYSPNHVNINTRLGLATETVYAPLVTDYPGLWTNDHRGDGIASLRLHCNTGEAKYFGEDYPHGLPQPSVVARLSPVYDPRDEAQEVDDPDTWEWGENAVLNLLWYLCLADGGPRYDFSTKILPTLSYWIAAANVCDEAVPLKAGGTEPRYRQGGVWRHDNAPADVIASYLACFDGWMAPRGDGALVIYAGKYYEPEVVFGQDVVTGYNFQRFVEDEQAVNTLIVSYTSPAHKYNEVQADPWLDEADISARGVERSEPFSNPWVNYNGQARRLAKRRMARLGATLRGTVTTNLYGLRGLGERYIRLQLSDIPALADIVVEIVEVEIDLASCSLTFNWIAADPNIDAWNPATEEGNAPGVVTRPALEGLSAPTIDLATPFYEPSGTGVAGVRVRLDVTGPDRTDLTWYARWRVDGGVSWSEAAYSDLDPEEAVVLETDFVTAGRTIELEVAYSTASGAFSPWSVQEEVSSSLEDVAPAAPSDLSGWDGGGEATIEWRNPNTPNFHGARVWRGADGAAFNTASDVSGLLPGGLGFEASFTDTGLSPDDYDYWVTAENATGARSAPVGPLGITVT